MVQSVAMKKRGVLLVNLGTPLSYQPKDVFRYLNEFLTDPRVIDFPWLKRHLFVRGFIVPTRYRQSAKQYRQLWTEEGSPLLQHGKAVQEKLQMALGPHYQVSLAMRYQFPSIQEGLEQLRAAQAEEIVIIPLFPQYASATTGSVHQKVMQHLQHWQVIPQLIFINHYFDHPVLLDAFCARARQYQIDSYDHILFSFHGLPERQIRKACGTSPCFSRGCCEESGQQRFCYKAQCHATAQGIVSRLALAKKDYTVCFQSRLGKEPWLQPYLSDVIEAAARNGHKRLLVFSPSFVCDCLETTYEISREYAHQFKKMGGEELQLVEGLNSHPLWIKALQTLILERH